MTRLLLCVGGPNDGERVKCETHDRYVPVYWHKQLELTVAEGFMSDMRPEAVMSSVQQTIYTVRRYKHKMYEFIYLAPENWRDEDALMHLFGQPI